MATVINFDVDQGTTFRRALTFTDAEDEPYALDGCTLRGMLREDYSDTSAAAYIDFAINAVTGTAVMTLSATTTASLSAITYVYDVELVLEDNTVIRCFEGKIKIRPEATK